MGDRNWNAFPPSSSQARYPHNSQNQPGASYDGLDSRSSISGPRNDQDSRPRTGEIRRRPVPGQVVDQQQARANAIQSVAEIVRQGPRHHPPPPASLWPAHDGPISRAPSAFGSLSVFEEPQEELLIDLSASDTEGPRHVRPSHPDRAPPVRDYRTQPNPVERDQEVALRLAQEFSLLDIDDPSDLPAVFREQMEAVQGRHSQRSATRNALLSLGPEEQDNQSSSESPDEERCDCEALPAYGGQCFFCYPCNCIFCPDCWPRSPPHRKTPVRGGIPHEKTDPKLARIIEQTLETDVDEKTQSYLHMRDEDSAWFGTVWDDSDLLFQDYGRYANLMAQMSGRKRQVRYPGLVSFVGQTGAGKSTLIKLLIELRLSTEQNSEVPVVGSVKNQDLPTSGDVHLYSDPVSSDTDAPILYADCEGLDGGEREPMGVKSRKVKKHLQTYNMPQEVKVRQNASERDLLWAINEKTQSREYIVRNLYPRLLYTFSDTIVFVTMNPRVIENVIDQLIDWAAAALEKSSNQPVLPHAIIILNAAENNTDPRLWDVDASTEHLMEATKEAIDRNHNLRARAAFWAPKQRRITSVRDLLLSYYSTIRVVRVPKKGRPNLIDQQIERLYVEIKTACKRSRRVKSQWRMLLNSDELQPYLQYAFDHFSRELDLPFDFVEASFANSPIPSDFGGNILKLARDILEVWKDRIDGPTIFKELSYLVASCVMLDSARRRTLGPAESVFKEYLEYFDDTLDDFCDHHWPCEYRSAEGRCVNVRSGHQAKGHQLKDGRVLAVQEYQSSFTADAFRQTFRSMIFKNLTALLMKLVAATGRSADREMQEAAVIHRDMVLKNFYRHLGGPSMFISHTACYACLVEPPEHALPCGHVLCTLCVRAFGTSLGKHAVEIAACPLHFEETEGHCPPGWPIFIKPPQAGTRILSLDGGGIRGIVELTILQQIERELGVGLYIQDFFDLIVGTSTGGIIALGLGAAGYSVEDCTRSFRSLCTKAFTKRRGIGIPGWEWLISASNHSKYETRPLEAALQTYVAEAIDQSGRDGDNDRCIGRRPGQLQSTQPPGYSSYRFNRSEKPDSEMKIWEAARATSAAPRVFKPFFHGPSGQSYQDGAIYHNNPVEVAVGEQRHIWPEALETHPDIVLSVGTGYNPKSENREPNQPSRPASRGVISHVRSLTRIGIDHIHNSLDCERTWKTFLEKSPPPPQFTDRYIRVNLALDGDPPHLDDVRQLNNLSEMARFRFTKERDTVRSIADRLIASSFYFEPLAPPNTVENPDGSFTLKGNILSRFPNNSEQILYLGQAFKQRSSSMFNLGHRDHEPYFLIREKRRERDAQMYLVKHKTISDMMQHGTFSMNKVEVRLTQRMAETEILFCPEGDRSHPTYYPISGFPRCLLDEEVASPSKAKFTPRLTRSRSSYQSRPRDAWRKTSQDEDISSSNPIDQFTDQAYVYPGDTLGVYDPDSHRRYAGDGELRVPGDRSNTPSAFALSPSPPYRVMDSPAALVPRSFMQQEYQQLTQGSDAEADDIVYELADTSVYVPPVELPTPFNRIGLAVTRDDDEQR
ncbi:hypothetical protein P168DRAFT_329858 [Aspergillus campestris IBT 28561]|uniref:FabD/lysophospholipase-like protein n=1 Tax=Aspergillus campestris (strain IBT 28561) TaxID=1392248 RepID=A0A2I1CU40_ASPC2|nr:uncharacterized protein P168DRAFT_329858 [Aspergillus campestris IBT 28561]PKY01131.1 hypothetical protein P168DRAFT_329858 [Aspergillus campestris IBT 28561]